MIYYDIKLELEAIDKDFFENAENLFQECG